MIAKGRAIPDAGHAVGDVYLVRGEMPWPDLELMIRNLSGSPTQEAESPSLVPRPRMVMWVSKRERTAVDLGTKGGGPRRQRHLRNGRESCRFEARLLTM
jgi:hypothetical protein